MCLIMCSWEWAQDAGENHGQEKKRNKGEIMDDDFWIYFWIKEKQNWILESRRYSFGAKGVGEAVIE